MSITRIYLGLVLMPMSEIRLNPVVYSDEALERNTLVWDKGTLGFI